MLRAMGSWARVWTADLANNFWQSLLLATVLLMNLYTRNKIAIYSVSSPTLQMKTLLNKESSSNPWKKEKQVAGVFHGWRENQREHFPGHRNHYWRMQFNPEHLAFCRPSPKSATLSCYWCRYIMPSSASEASPYFIKGHSNSFELNK